MPARQGSFPVWKNTDLIRLHDTGGSKIDVYISSRDQSVNVIATGDAESVAEKIAQPQARRRRNLSLDDFADVRRHTNSIEAPVIVQVLDVSLQRPIDLCG